MIISFFKGNIYYIFLNYVKIIAMEIVLLVLGIIVALFVIAVIAVAIVEFSIFHKRGDGTISIEYPYPSDLKDIDITKEQYSLEDYEQFIKKK